MFLVCSDEIILLPPIGIVHECAHCIQTKSRRTAPREPRNCRKEMFFVSGNPRPYRLCVGSVVCVRACVLSRHHASILGNPILIHLYACVCCRHTLAPRPTHTYARKHARTHIHTHPHAHPYPHITTYTHAHVHTPHAHTLHRARDQCHKRIQANASKAFSASPGTPLW